jgi:indolepyruvate ferredoxin oxidoreductase beta subunit
MTKSDFLLVGVGGQGIILAGNVLTAVGLKMGLDIKKSEARGMAQRGGSVTNHVRWGDRVGSPLIGRGEADFLLSFEKLEALRHIEMIRPGATVLVNDYAVPPLSVSSGGDEYPDDELVEAVLATATPDHFLIPGSRLAQELGNAKAGNIVMLGSLSHFIADVPLAVWLEAVAEQVPPKSADLNQRAFQVGREAVEKLCITSKSLAGDQ